MPDTRVADAYLQIEGIAPGNRYDWGDKATVRGVTNTRPTVIKFGCIVVKVQLRIPVQAWEAFEAEAVIDVPADLVQRPIAVTAVDAND